MQRNRSIPNATVIPVLIYPDVREAVAWLSRAFGFEERLQIGENHRSKLQVGYGAVIIGDVRGNRRPPRANEVTHSVVVPIQDASICCERVSASLSGWNSSRPLRPVLRLSSSVRARHGSPDHSGVALRTVPAGRTLAAPPGACRAPVRVR